MEPEQQASAMDIAVEGAEDEVEEGLEAATSTEATGVVDTAATTRATDAEEGEEEAVEAVAVAEVVLQLRRVTATRASRGTIDFRVTLHSLDYWVIDSGATYSITLSADLLTELEPSPVKHVTSAFGQRAEVKGMGKAMFKGADGKMVGLKNVVMDVVVPLKLGVAGAEYFLTIVEVYTRITWVYVLSKKSDVAETVKTDWFPMVQRQKDRLVMAIRNDRGGEFLSRELSLWLKKNGIRHSLTMPYSPAMNGIGEQANRTITEQRAGCSLELGYPTISGLMQKGQKGIQAPNRLTYDALGKPAKSALAGAAMMVGDGEESEYEEFAFAFFSLVEMAGKPATLKEASESSDAKEWKKAMESELKSIEENDTWELVLVLPRAGGAGAGGAIGGFGGAVGAGGAIGSAIGSARGAGAARFRGAAGAGGAIGAAVYVDDLVFATAHIEALALVKVELQERYTCTDLGPSALRLPVSSPQPTPLSTSQSLSAPPSDESVEPSGLYPELVGCLIYLITCTRPHLAYPLSLLARYVAPCRHRKVHWDAAKRVLCYLCSTSGMGLMLGGQGSMVLTRHCDSSWVDDQATQRSSQGYTFSLGSGSVSWRSTRSSSVLSSSCEAKIYAGAMAAQELRWLTYLLTDLEERPRSPPVLYVNKEMLAVCHEQRLEHRTKHIALCYFLSRELQQRRQLCLSYVAS
ncbi:unnamed protein product [Closterium sp. NIES-54]